MHTKLKAWKNGMENRGLRVNIKKTKFMYSGAGLDVYNKVEWEQTLLAVPNANFGSIRSAD